MQPRNPSLRLCFLVAVCCACGGKASSRDGANGLVDEPAPESIAAPVEELPGSLEVLELRRSGPGEPSTAPRRCDPDDYSVRLKVNFELGLLINVNCDEEAGVVRMATGSVQLSDAQLALVQDAYEAVRVSTARQCASGTDTLTLDLSPEGRDHIVYGDDAHSTCPMPGREGFVAGLDELYSLLVSMSDR